MHTYIIVQRSKAAEPRGTAKIKFLIFIRITKLFLNTSEMSIE